MDQGTNQIFFALLRSAICGEMLKDTERAMISEENVSEMLALAKEHDIAHLLSLALKKNGYVSRDSAQIERAVLKAIYRYEQLNYEHENLCEALEGAEIPFLPLKGSVLRRYYPEAWMRTSCDVDVLVSEENTARAVSVLSEQCGFQYQHKGPHDIVLLTPSQMSVELHYTLIEDGRIKDSTEVLKSVWETSAPRADREYWYEMSDELFYFYHIAHMAKHFENGGCGIRSFIDLWLLDRLEGVDQSKRDELLTRGGLKRFSDVSRKLSRMWLEGEEADDASQKMADYILRGGIYGIYENRIAVQQEKRGGWLKYTLSKVFVPYEELKFVYPILEKHRWLTPVMEVRRWCRLLFRGHTGRVVKELKYNRAVSANQADKTKQFLSDIGL